jgi:ketosteroid isomerase-like protein
MKIKTRIMSSIVGVFLLILMINSCSVNSTDVTEQIKESNKVFMDAVLNGDTNTLSAMYTNDAKLFPANSDVIDGKEAIGKFWSATLNMGIKKVLFETETAQKFGNIAIEEGKYALYVEGDHIVDQGKYIVTWKNEEGSWKVFRDIWNESTPAPVQRANVNDNVIIVLNHVKADKVAQFEDFYRNYLSLAGSEISPQAKATVRLEKPTGQNKAGYFTYIFLIDPFVESNNYDILWVLSEKFGESKAQEYFKMYLDCLKDGATEVYMSEETGW